MTWSIICVMRRRLSLPHMCTPVIRQPERIAFCSVSQCKSPAFGHVSRSLMCAGAGLSGPTHASGRCESHRSEATPSNHM
jgi:hypothetical protein